MATAYVECSFPKLEHPGTPCNHPVPVYVNKAIEALEIGDWMPYFEEAGDAWRMLHITAVMEHGDEVTFTGSALIGAEVVSRTGTMPRGTVVSVEP